MTPEVSGPERLESLRDFYGLMAGTRDVRAAVVADVLQGRRPASRDVEALQLARESLGRAAGPDAKARFKVDESMSLLLDVTYELTELDKDVIYLTKGESALLDHMAEIHPGFARQVATLAERLRNVRFNCFITDRDGTVNNYCSGYRSSVQSAYNAVWLARFAAKGCASPIIITSAPLKDFGIMDLCAMPEATVIYGASKGREFTDLDGRRRACPVDPDKQKALDELNARLTALIAEPGYERFGLIGSGLQFKFGQTTLARQEVSRSIEPERSEELLKRVRGLVAELDPGHKYFRIEDTGLDIEIILTIESADGLKDFDKGDAVAYLDGELDLNLEKGPHLVCGDTPSDVPMARAVLDRCPDTLAVFVTTRDDLAGQVRGIRPDWLLTPAPDMLVAALGAEL